jgi:hypothetical protein
MAPLTPVLCALCETSPPKYAGDLLTMQRRLLLGFLEPLVGRPHVLLRRFVALSCGEIGGEGFIVGCAGLRLGCFGSVILGLRLLQWGCCGVPAVSSPCCAARRH